MKILIIEDEKLLADSLKTMLEAKGFEVETAYDGETGAEYAELGIYDLLILDVMMPKLNGYQLAREVRAKRLTTPILMELLEQKNVFTSITVMVQKEVADRIRSGPGSKEYGALSLAVQYFARPEPALNVSPSNFIPRPSVDSCVLRLEAYREPPVECSEKVMFALIRAAFNQRRKTLANAISHGYTLGGKQYTREEVTGALDKMGLPPTVRGEALSLEQFAQLSILLDPENAEALQDNTSLPASGNAEAQQSN